MSNNCLLHLPTRLPASLQQELLSKTPPPVAAASCGGIIGMSTTTSLRLDDRGDFDQIYVTFNTEDNEEQDKRLFVQNSVIKYAK